MDEGRLETTEARWHSTPAGAPDESAVERIEARCLEQSLENLRTLCETSPSKETEAERGRRRRGVRSWLS